MIDVRFARQFPAIIGQGVALLEDEADAPSGPELGEEFLSVMLAPTASPVPPGSILREPGSGKPARPSPAGWRELVRPSRPPH
jgi:hypothetical protein